MTPKIPKILRPPPSSPPWCGYGLSMSGGGQIESFAPGLGPPFGYFSLDVFVFWPGGGVVRKGNQRETVHLYGILCVNQALFCILCTFAQVNSVLNKARVPPMISLKFPTFKPQAPDSIGQEQPDVHQVDLPNPARTASPEKKTTGGESPTVPQPHDRGILRLVQ